MLRDYWVYNGIIGTEGLKPLSAIEVFIRLQAIRRSHNDVKLHVWLQVKKDSLMLGQPDQHPLLMDHGRVMIGVTGKLRDNEIGYPMRVEAIQGLVKAVNFAIQDSPDKLGSKEIFAKVSFDRNIGEHKFPLWSNADRGVVPSLKRLEEVFDLSGVKEVSPKAALTFVLAPA